MVLFPAWPPGLGDTRMQSAVRSMLLSLPPHIHCPWLMANASPMRLEAETRKEANVAFTVWESQVSVWLSRFGGMEPVATSRAVDKLNKASALLLLQGKDIPGLVRRGFPGPGNAKQQECCFEGHQPVGLTSTETPGAGTSLRRPPLEVASSTPVSSLPAPDVSTSHAYSPGWRRCALTLLDDLLCLLSDSSVP